MMAVLEKLFFFINKGGQKMLGIQPVTAANGRSGTPTKQAPPLFSIYFFVFLLCILFIMAIIIMRQQ